MTDDRPPRVVFFTGRLRKVGTEDPTYWLEVGVKTGDRTTASTWISASGEKLLSWSYMEAAIFKRIDVVPILDLPKKTGANEYWKSLIGDWSYEIEREAAPAEASRAGLLIEKSLEWLSGLRKAEQAAEFERGNWRYETPGGLTAFRSRDLREHLAQSGPLPEPREVWAALAPAGFANSLVKIEKRVFRVWSYPTGRLESWLIETRHGMDDEDVTISTNGVAGVTEW